MAYVDSSSNVWHHSSPGHRIIDMSVAIYPHNTMSKNYLKTDQWLTKIQWKVSLSKLGLWISKLAKGD